MVFKIPTPRSLSIKCTFFLYNFSISVTVLVITVNNWLIFSGYVGVGMFDVHRLLLKIQSKNVKHIHSSQHYRHCLLLDHKCTRHCTRRWSIAFDIFSRPINSVPFIYPRWVFCYSIWSRNVYQEESIVTYTTKHKK